MGWTVTEYEGSPSARVVREVASKKRTKEGWSCRKILEGSVQSEESYFNPPQS